MPEDRNYTNYISVWGPRGGTDDSSWHKDYHARLCHEFLVWVNYSMEQTDRQTYLTHSWCQYSALDTCKCTTTNDLHRCRRFDTANGHMRQTLHTQTSPQYTRDRPTDRPTNRQTDRRYWWRYQCRWRVWSHREVEISSIRRWWAMMHWC